MIRLKPALIACCLVLAPVPALADYVATGPFKGLFCSNFGIKFCNFKRVDALSENGQMVEIRREWDYVDEHSERKGLCWVRLRNTWMTWLFGNTEVFYRHSKGPRHKIESYERLGTPDNVVFKCVKQ